MAAKLLEHGISIFGVDTLSLVEPTSGIESIWEQVYEDDPSALHHKILGSGGFTVENLTNLREPMVETPGVDRSFRPTQTRQNR